MNMLPHHPVSSCGELPRMMEDARSRQRPCDHENENRSLKLGHNFHSPRILSTRILHVVHFDQTLCGSP
jgi:hypothetical protein